MAEKRREGGRKEEESVLEESWLTLQKKQPPTILLLEFMPADHSLLLPCAPHFTCLLPRFITPTMRRAYSEMKEGRGRTSEHLLTTAVYACAALCACGG